MASTTLAGRGGSVVLPGTPLVPVAYLRTWSLQIDAANLDTSALGDFWRNFVPGGGFRTWQGSCTGFYVIDQDTNGQAVIQNAILTGITLTMQFQTAQGRGYYEGVTNITQQAIVDDAEQMITAAWTFVGTGSLQHAP